MGSLRVSTRRRLVARWDRRAGRATVQAWTESSRPWVCSRVTGCVLDVCVGDGANLAYYPNDIELTAVDWSPGMVEATRRVAARIGRQIDIQVGDAEHLPFPDGVFDTVVATFALCCVPDEYAVLVEMARVLKPGGHLLLADTVASDNPLIRLVEHVSDLVSVPLEGHHQTRRPRLIVETLGLRIVETEQEYHPCF